MTEALRPLGVSGISQILKNTSGIFPHI